MLQDRDLKKTAKTLKDSVKLEGDMLEDRKGRKEALAGLIEARLVNAAWVLRRMPDRERGFLKLRGAIWPDTMPEPGMYPNETMSAFEARKRVRISAAEIDGMQPMLDLLLLLPDVSDRKLVFWAAWHQEGETGNRIAWMKVRRSLGTNLSRWTLKRRYSAALIWLAALVAIQ